MAVFATFFLIKVSCYTIKVEKLRGGEVAQQLRLLAAFVEDPGLVPSFHVVPHNRLQFQL